MLGSTNSISYFKPIAGILAILLVLTACSEGENPITDAQKLAAMRKVTLSYEGMDYEFSFPAGALSGASFADLLLNDSSTYKNPANYAIGISVEAKADNTDADAEDAKFDGLGIDLVMNDLTSEPIELQSGPFEVPKGTTQEVSLGTTINLETHRQTGLYIFRQTVDGNDLSTTLYPYFLYNIGTLEGEIPLPALHKDIPTRASDETKEFLRQLLESGIFEE